MLKKFLIVSLKVIGWILLLPVLVITMFVFSGPRMNIEEYGKYAVDQTQVSQWFPVVILREGPAGLDADILNLVNYSSYVQGGQNVPADFPIPDIDLSTLSKVPGYLFSIPVNQVQQLNAQLQEKCQTGRNIPHPMNGGCYLAEFEILENASDHQYIKAHLDTDYDYINIGWYEVRNNWIYPKYHTHYFGPGVAMVSGVQSIVWACGIYLGLLLMYFGIKIYKRTKKKPKPTPGVGLG